MADRENDYLEWLDEITEQLDAVPTLMETGLKDFLIEMSISQKREIKSYLIILIQHLLKVKYQPAKATRSWKLSIDNSRGNLSDIANENKKRFRSIFTEILEDPTTYSRARNNAETETGLTLPKENPFTWAQLFDENFYGN